MIFDQGKNNKLLKKHHQVLENQNDVFDQGKKLLFHQTRSTTRVKNQNDDFRPL